MPHPLISDEMAIRIDLTGSLKQVIGGWEIGSP